MKKIKCIIDTDPGVDDSVAIALSLYDDIMDIRLITTVCGNKDIDTVTRNAWHILEKFNRTDIPLAKGASKAMKRVSADASFVHKEYGMGGYIPPEVRPKLTKLGAVEQMYKVICENSNDICVIALGPHTNLGKLIVKHPDVVNKISHIYTEGCSPYGWEEEGSWINYISFNASRDPEALQIVVNSGIPITFVSSRMGRELANFTEAEVNYIKSINDVGRFIYEMYSGYWAHGYADRRIETNDTCAVLTMRCPKLFKTIKVDMFVNTTDMPGKTTMVKNKHGKINLVRKINRKKMHKFYFNAVKKLDRFNFYN